MLTRSGAFSVQAASSLSMLNPWVMCLSAAGILARCVSKQMKSSDESMAVRNPSRVGLALD